MTFKTPVLLLLIPLILPALFYVYFRRKPPAISFPSVAFFDGLPKTWRLRFRHVPFFLRMVVLSLFIVALAGPESFLEGAKSTTEGISMALLLDSSTSMAAEDFTVNGVRQNRLDVIKSVLKDFITRRTNDRLALIAFAAKPYTVSPLTTDQNWLLKNLDRVQFGLMEDGTAIGSAIVSGIARLRKAEGKSKVIILLTDGVNNAGKMPPLEAADAAAALGIKIYTIGAGTKDFAPYPVVDIFGRKTYQQVKIEIDEDMLQKIASKTGGAYFRATDTQSLKDIYSSIDKMEKVTFDDNGYRQVDEHFDKVLCVALIILFIEILLARTVFLRIP
ncbi:MAG: VWA domain-containing protein [Candidatus Omnitrophota bacterium]